MSLVNKIAQGFDFRMDTDQFDADHYKVLANGGAQDRSDAGDYLLREVVPRIPSHLIRGAIIGGVVGLGVSGLTHQDTIIPVGAVCAAALDWSQYCARILIKAYT